MVFLTVKEAGGKWLIPANIEKTKDGRTKEQNNE